VAGGVRRFRTRDELVVWGTASDDAKRKITIEQRTAVLSAPAVV
jgi:predicted Fe-S protein YdhL (DUF1289 family)